MCAQAQNTEVPRGWGPQPSARAPAPQVAAAHLHGSCVPTRQHSQTHTISSLFRSNGKLCTVIGPSCSPSAQWPGAGPRTSSRLLPVVAEPSWRDHGSVACPLPTNPVRGPRHHGIFELWIGTCQLHGEPREGPCRPRSRRLAPALDTSHLPSEAFALTSP